MDVQLIKLLLIIIVKLMIVYIKRKKIRFYFHSRDHGEKRHTYLKKSRETIRVTLEKLQGLIRVTRTQVLDSCL